MTVYFILLTASLILAALYVSGSVKPPLRAKASASLAFVTLGAYSLLAPGGRIFAITDPGTDLTVFRMLLFCGLCFGALGDVLLELFNAEDKRFFLGVGAFFTGHALYAASFFCVDGSSAWIAVLCALPAAAILTVLSARLLTFCGARRLILLAYMFALSFMCAYAWVILVRRGIAPFRLIAPGATLFLISDCALGLQLFGGDRLAKHRRLLGTICLITYYLAQNMIATALAFS